MASRICFIPSCSPVAEIRRTSRARIWPLILGSSSVATVHHSSQKTLSGPVVCPRLKFARASDGRGPQLLPGLYSQPGARVYTELLARAHLSQDPAGEVFERCLLLLFLATPAHVDCPPFGLRVSDDEQVRNLLAGVLPDLLLHAVLRVIHLDPDARAGERLLHPAGVVQMSVRHGNHHGLNWRAPGWGDAAVVLDQDAHEPLRRTGYGPVQQDRRMSLAVLANVLAPEPGRLDKVDLDRGELPLSPEHILRHKVCLGSVECGLARRRPIGDAG